MQQQSPALMSRIAAAFKRSPEYDLLIEGRNLAVFWAVIVGVPLVGFLLVYGFWDMLRDLFH